MRFFEMSNENMMDGNKKGIPKLNWNETITEKVFKCYTSKTVFENLFFCTRSLTKAET